MWLEGQGTRRNSKTVLRVMQKYEVLAAIRRPRKRRQVGQQVHRYENLLNREFYADKPNTKWVTAISYIQTGQGVLYLSMIRDLKTECIHRQNIAAFRQTGEMIDDFIYFYNHERIQLKAGAALLSLRHSA